jgi:hypothetical protein
MTSSASSPLQFESAADYPCSYSSQNPDGDKTCRVREPLEANRKAFR